MRVRAFIAVKISDEQRNSIAEVLDRLRRHDVSIKWVEPKNMHITLKFLGDTAEENLPQLFDAVEDALDGARRFELKLTGLGQFPPRKPPRVIWAGIESCYDSLKDLAHNIDTALKPFGFEPEKRKFSAHVTIGRVKNNRNIRSVTDDLEKIRFDTPGTTVSEVVFFKSDLTPKGPIYTPLKKFELNS